MDKETKNISNEMSALLYNFWVIKDDNPELYYQLKNNQNLIKDFVVKNLGSNFIIHDRFIKLEKLPTIPKANTGIPNFTSVLDYVMLSIFLTFLEDKTRGDKFILSDLIDYIKNTAITLELDHVPDWNLAYHRRSLVNVINFLLKIGAIKLKDEDKVSFADSKEADALYETTGISNYVMRLFDNDIHDVYKPSDFLKNEFLTQSEDKGDVRRYKVFRNILYTPSVFMKELSPSEIDYIKKNRFYIKHEIDDKLDLSTEITHNMAFIYEDENNNNKDNFPNNKKISEIVLMINDILLNDIKTGKITLDEYEVASIDASYLLRIIKDIKELKKPYLSKQYQNLGTDKFYDEITTYMQDYNFIRKDGDTILIYPSIGRMIGITKEIKPTKDKQIELFGGKNEE